MKSELTLFWFVGKEMLCWMLRFNEPSCRRLRLNISQYGDCSNKYITSAGIKVVYRRFGTRELEQVIVVSWQQAKWPLRNCGCHISTRGCVAWPPIECWPHFCKPPTHKRQTLVWPASPASTNCIVTASRTDSDLEAFSHNPTDGSFVPLPGRASTCTKCPNLRFLSYWAGFLS